MLIGLVKILEWEHLASIVLISVPFAAVADVVVDVLRSPVAPVDSIGLADNLADDLCLDLADVLHIFVLPRVLRLFAAEALRLVVPPFHSTILPNVLCDLIDAL